MNFLILFVSLFFIIFSANTICPSEDETLCNLSIYNVNSRRHPNVYDNTDKNDSNNEQENHLLAYKNALKFLIEVPRHDNNYEESKDYVTKQEINQIFKNNFNIKFNRLINMKILKKKALKNPCKDKYSICKLWKKNAFCHNSFYSKFYRGHICPRSCGLC